MCLRPVEMGWGDRARQVSGGERESGRGGMEGGRGGWAVGTIARPRRQLGTQCEAELCRKTNKKASYFSEHCALSMGLASPFAAGLVAQSALPFLGGRPFAQPVGALPFVSGDGRPGQPPLWRSALLSLGPLPRQAAPPH